jgi:hypothetical protein
MGHHNSGWLIPVAGIIAKHEKLWVGKKNQKLATRAANAKPSSGPKLRIEKRIAVIRWCDEGGRRLGSQQLWRGERINVRHATYLPASPVV